MYRIFVGLAAPRESLTGVVRGPQRLDRRVSRGRRRGDQAADETWDPAALTEQAFERERIEAAWAHLHKQHRVVLSLHEIEGYSLEEVAHIIEVPLGTAKSRLNRARNRLRALLTEGTNSPAPTCNPSETS